MASHRPPSSLGRPPSRNLAISGSGRPPTAVRPPPTALQSSPGVVPGTSGPPGMRGVLAHTGVLSAAIRVTDRPITQQGLSGMKTSVRGPHRQILDKSYYLGLLRGKINELTAEISKLHKEMENYNQENSVYLSYEKRAEGLAADIKELQGHLADYNMLVDKLNTNTEMEEMTSDYNMMKAQSDCKAQSIDSIFTERRKREEAVRAIEEEISRERRVADDVIQSMPATKQETYFTMMATNEELLNELAVLQEELDILVTRKENSEAELSHSRIKWEVVRLHDMLSALKAKRDAMEAEHKSLDSPKQERDKLLEQVKEDNQEIASMERQLSETRDRIRQAKEQIGHLDQGSDAAQGERQQKYKELKRKEEEINRFLESFEEFEAQELYNQAQIQQNIVSVLELCSRNMLRLCQVDAVSASELKTIQELLVSKETEMVQSESTARGLTTESLRLQQDLEKVQQLEGKIKSELGNLKEQVNRMESELDTFRDLDTLRLTAEEKKNRLLENQVSLTQRQDPFRQLLEEMNHKYEAQKTKLQGNETHVQLANLERKWQHLEKNNLVMKEFIASKTQQCDYAFVAKNVYQQVADYNKRLKELLQSHQS